MRSSRPNPGSVTSEIRLRARLRAPSCPRLLGVTDCLVVRVGGGGSVSLHVMPSLAFSRSAYNCEVGLSVATSEKKSGSSVLRAAGRIRST